jgi:hypothetical protein
MTMQSLFFMKPGAFEWREVARPTLTADTDAIVRPLAVARFDLDLYIAAGVIPLPGPFAICRRGRPGCRSRTVAGWLPPRAASSGAKPLRPCELISS